MFIGVKMMGPYKTLFGNGTAYGNITGAASYNSTTGTWTVTGAATVDIIGETNAAVLMCKNLVVNGGTLTVSTNCKGLAIWARDSVTLLNGGKIHINLLGKAGNFGNVTPVTLLPTAARSFVNTAKLATYSVAGTGGSGGAGVATYGNAPGNNGSAAGSMQTGGGGSGGKSVNNSTGTSSAGGAGGPCCGGAGGGGISGGSTNTLVMAAAGAYGGPGTDGNTNQAPYPAGGGAGNPVGVDSNAATTATGAGGGLLMLFTKSLSIASGCAIQSNGGVGGSGAALYVGGGSAGGGCVCIVTKTGGYVNNGTVQAAGGAGGVPTYNATAASQCYGGSGGAGSVNTFTV